MPAGLSFSLPMLSRETTGPAAEGSLRMQWQGAGAGLRILPMGASFRPRRRPRCCGLGRSTADSEVTRMRARYGEVSSNLDTTMARRQTAGAVVPARRQEALSTRRGGLESGHHRRAGCSGKAAGGPTDDRAESVHRRRHGLPAQNEKLRHTQYQAQVRAQSHFAQKRRGLSLVHGHR